MAGKMSPVWNWNPYPGNLPDGSVCRSEFFPGSLEVFMVGVTAIELGVTHHVEIGDGARRVCLLCIVCKNRFKIDSILESENS